MINGSVPILSPREKRILRRLARGYSDRAIAVQIGGRPEQVGEQRKRLLQKLQISSQSELQKPPRSGRLGHLTNSLRPLTSCMLGRSIGRTAAANRRPELRLHQYQ
ncbi:LuxR C-terminal-related transcriptional regulator [Bradyrhizobium sp. I1.7.5]|uniref:LuxR C-terminal-related transcriptional regulator n=1 Tax=Bradyrhizobium sp. I1.7.5 TaxID=3156363 RepID=UPI003390ADFA